MNLTKGARFCSSCHCQHVEMDYVDFDAYWDGPVLEGSIKQPIDDLVICKDCVTAAATLIGMVNKKEMIKENYQLGKAVDAKEEEIEALRRAISNLEYTLKLALDGKVKRGNGRPRVHVIGELEEAAA